MAQITKQVECYKLDQLMSALSDALDVFYSYRVGVATNNNTTVWVTHVTHNDGSHTLRIGAEPYILSEDD